MFRSPVRSLPAVAAVVALLLGAAGPALVPVGTAAAEGRDIIELKGDVDETQQALTPAMSLVAATLYWWCLDQPRPTACR